MHRLTRVNTVIGCLALAAAVTSGAVHLVVRDEGTPTQPTGAAPSTPITSASASPTEPASFTLLVSGDVLLRDTLWEQASEDSGGDGYDFRPMLEGVRAVISAADLAICHMETPVGPAGGPFSDYPIFSVPPEVVNALAWTGYDVCTTASNHTIDKGEEGVVRTLDAFDAAGLVHAGSARSPAEATTPTVIEVPHAITGEADIVSARVAVLSYTYGLNGFTRPTGKEWLVNLIDEDAILADAKAAREAGADVVLVALHWGVEYTNDPTAEQRELAQALAGTPDIDLIYGHHAHVAQPFDVIEGTWVAYGLGNHLAEQSTQPERTHEGMMARFTFTEGEDGGWRVTAAEFLPTRVPLTPPFRLFDLTVGRDSAADRDSYDRIGEIADRLGASEHGLRPAEADG